MLFFLGEFYWVHMLIHFRHLYCRQSSLPRYSCDRGTNEEEYRNPPGIVQYFS